MLSCGYSAGDARFAVFLKEVVDGIGDHLLSGAVLFEREQAQLPMGGGVEVDGDGLPAAAAGGRWSSWTASGAGAVVGTAVAFFKASPSPAFFGMVNLLL